MRKLLPFLLCQMFMMAPDGGGAGGGSLPLPTDLAELIKLLEAAEKKDRQAILNDLAKTLGIPFNETVEKLKEAGWDPKKKNSSDTPSDKKTGDKKTEGIGAKEAVSLRHRTPYPCYRRAGLVLTDQFKPYEVSVDQLEVLKKDPWVEIGK